MRRMLTFSEDFRRCYPCRRQLCVGDNTEEMRMVASECCLAGLDSAAQPDPKLLMRAFSERDEMHDEIL